MLLAFSSESCPACKRAAPRLDAAVKACGGERVVERMDVDSERGQTLAAAYGVALIPAFVSVDSGGREVSRLIGVQTEQRLERAIEEVLGTRCAAVDSASDAEPM